MILSVSQRTDIPSFYGDWFINRIKEGYLHVKNPYNFNQISHINLSPEIVDCIVFLTKNPIPFMNKLEYLEKYKYFFHFTITPYGKDIERNIPNKKEAIIPAFKKLSNLLGKEKMVLRYDPIFLTKKYTIEYHLRAFEYIIKELHKYTKKVVISFIDMYKKVIENTGNIGLNPLEMEHMILIGKGLGDIAKSYNINIVSCVDKINLEEYGIERGTCIDREYIENIVGSPLKDTKLNRTRKNCSCMDRYDVGTYNTCKNGCIYCYANNSQEMVNNISNFYKKESTILCSQISKDATISISKHQSLKINQKNLFGI